MDDTPQHPRAPAPPAESPVETLLREAAAEAIRKGRVPAHQASRIWGGSGSGRSCPVCRKRVEESQFEIEMEFAPNGSQWRVMRLHVQCCSAWEWARRDFPGGQIPHAPVQGPAEPSGNGVSLQEGGGDTSIGACERHSEVRRGPA